jgi:GLPGLI family protein
MNTCNKISNVIFFIIVFLPITFFAQDNGMFTISYKAFVNGSDAGPEMHRTVMAGYSSAKSGSATSEIAYIPEKPVEKEYIDYSKKIIKQVANLSDGTSIFYETDFNSLPVLEMTGENDTILGYACSKAITTLRSNKIEIWFTKELKVMGTPAYAYGVPEGLILRIRRNNNWELSATQITRTIPEQVIIIPENPGVKMDAKNYRHRITQNYVKRINIFNDEQICWGTPKKNPDYPVLDSVFRYAGGTVILKKVKLPLVTDDYQIFAEVTQYSNGDAYDRTGTIFCIIQDKKLSMLNALNEGIDHVPFFTGKNGKKYEGMIANDAFSPAIELMRFFTSFGIGHYNDKVQVLGTTWQQKSIFKQEITDLLPLLGGEIWIGAFIGNYDAGGHNLSLDLIYYPGSQTINTSISKEVEIIPLFNTLNFMEMAGQNYGSFFEKDTLSVNFEVKDTSKSYILRYITTGHGGWENGDEFVQKTNSIFLNDKLIFNYIPWRTDCMNYREFNPSSGNFWNGLSSSDYSRSGWCPGSVTNPIFIELGNMKPGDHTLKIAIPQGKDEGGSFSAWAISGVLMGMEKIGK